MSNLDLIALEQLAREVITCDFLGLEETMNDTAMELGMFNEYYYSKTKEV